MPAGLSRRAFLQSTGLLAASLASARNAPLRPARITDTHVHFFDPSRPQGVPWPPSKDTVLYRTTMPAEYRACTVPQKVDGVVVVEASPWVEDNQWLLDLADREPLILGVVGNLRPGDEDFRKHLKRFAANPRFRGIRFREGDLEKLVADARFLDDLRAVAGLGLVFDVHSPPAWAGPAVRLATAIPNLRLVVNHVANAPTNGAPPSADWLSLIAELAARPSVRMKVSGLVEGTKRTAGDAPASPETYAPVLEALWRTFGAQRLLYASNWPVSARNAPLARVQQIALDSFAAKGQDALDCVFWQNAQACYGLSTSPSEVSRA